MAKVYISAVERLALDGHLACADASAEDLLLVTSSAEIGILGSPAARRLVEDLLPSSTPAARLMISQGCVGFFACVLEFLRGTAATAKVLVLETPSPWVQATLDAAGVGRGADGFVAQDVAYRVTLSRKPSPGAMSVRYCAVMAREPAIFGTGKLAARLVSTLADVRRCYPAARMVTFENSSEWSRRLATLVNAMAVRAGLAGRDTWLPSVECDQRHYMTARPLMDLQAHGKCLAGAPLLLTCLGAGGRLGLMLVTAPADDDTPFQVAMPAGVPLDCEVPSLDDMRRARNAGAKVLYSLPAYFGLQHTYFRWRLTHEFFQAAQTSLQDSETGFQLPPVGAVQAA